MIKNNKLPVLVVGASGHLGTMITEELLNRNDIMVSIIVQDPDRIKELSQRVTSSGGKVFRGDVLMPETLVDTTKGIHTVISTLTIPKLIGDNDVMINGQVNMLEECTRNGVKRFVPSDFSMNIWGVKTGTNYFVDQRLRFREKLEKTQVKGLHFTDGIFMETYFWLAEKQGFGFWEDINIKLDLTSMRDMARFVVSAVSDKNKIGDVMVVGSEVSTKEIVDTYNKVTGKNVKAEKLGSLNDLSLRIKEMKEKGSSFDALQLGMFYLMFSGKGKIHKKMNDMFTDVKVTSLEDFIKMTNGKPMVEYTMQSVAQHIEPKVLLEYSC